MKTPIYLCLAHMGGGEQRYIQEAFDTNWVVPLGPNVNGFEEDLAEFLQQSSTSSLSTASTSLDSCTSKHTPHVCALSSGTAALHLAMVLLDIKAGDEVICQSFTFAASANPITYQGATPIFVDSEPDTWNMSPQLLQEAIEDRIAQTGKKPKAIVVVHLYGMPAKMREIQAIATHYDIPIIEDAAEALGSTYEGQQCGTFGHFGVLSFNGNKMITTGGGGAIICPTAEAKQRALFFATQARENYPYYQHEHIGFNYRLSNISAGIGRGQMEVLPQHIAHHQHLADLYTQAFADNPYITLHTNPDAASSSNYWLNTITLSEDAPCSTNVLREALAEEKIESRPLWKPMHLQPVFQNAPAYVNGVSEDLFKRGLCLPSGPWVTEEDLQRIVDICRSTLTKEANLKK